MKPAQAVYLFLTLLVLLLAALLLWTPFLSDARAAGLLGGVGQLMAPVGGSGGGPPVETFRITTLGGDPITTLDGDYIVIQGAP